MEQNNPSSNNSPSSQANVALDHFEYDNAIVRNFAYATILWGVVGMLVGLLIAHQMFLPSANFGLSFTTFGRLRPLHTNAVIFAFVGNAIFMGVYYSLQRVLKARLYSDLLSSIHFWGWQLIIVAAALTLPFGYTTSKEYAELEWPIDIAIALVWVVFGLNMIMTIMKRRTTHIYVAVWFYLATFLTIAVLHIVNSFELPVSFLKSYSAYAGVQDALVQWWYGHNAVAFFLTTPFLGLMYYFVPKAANRPVYSYRLSIMHFWTLIFIYIWAGPHHLLYTALPDWVQSVGTVFSVMLILPSWGGGFNGLLTLRGAWDKVKEDPILKFFVVGITAYTMATFEGPLLSFKSVNAIAHYTDWIVGHVHIGALGWNGFLTFAMLYFIIPKVFQTKLYSIKLANFHFWIGTIGIIFYAIPLYWAGWTQYFMWQEFTDAGFLAYGNFLETVVQIIPMYVIRAIGGTLYLVGVFVMVYNIIKTVKQGTLLANEPASSAPRPTVAAPMKYYHEWFEKRPLQMLFFSLIAISIGGLVEFIPTWLVKSNVPEISSVKPYTPLELQGRDIYIKEGCVGCHSQMIRPLRHEVERYGEYSKAGEFVYDRPFLWGSKRTGPDLHRLGGKYSDSWHYNHMYDPTTMSPGSIMPPYPWLLENEVDLSTTGPKIETLQTLGVPYPKGYAEKANEDLKKQAALVVESLKKDDIEGVSPTSEIVALIAYLQRLGTDIKGEDTLPEK